MRKKGRVGVSNGDDTIKASNFVLLELMIIVVERYKTPVAVLLVQHMDKDPILFRLVFRFPLRIF